MYATEISTAGLYTTILQSNASVLVTQSMGPADYPKK